MRRHCGKRALWKVVKKPDCSSINRGFNSCKYLRAVTVSPLNMPVWCRVGDVWCVVGDVLCRVGDVWSEVGNVWCGVGDVWCVMCSNKVCHVVCRVVCGDDGV